MKNEIGTLEGLVEKLESDELCGEEAKLVTIQDVVDEIIELGNTDHVYARHDDYLSLAGDLSDEFKKSLLDTINESKFENDIERLLDEANMVIKLYLNPPRDEDDFD